jgi:ammonia channel protein AmtB
MNGEPTYSVTDPMGYDSIAQKYKNGEWDILRVHQFIKAYDTKLSDSSFNSQSPQQVVLGTLILWVGWLLFNGGSSFGSVGDKGVAASRAMMNSIISPSSAGLVTFALE